MVNNSVDCNQLFIVVNLIEDQIFLQDQDQIPLTFQDSIPRYCTGITISAFHIMKSYSQKDRLCDQAE